MIPLLAGSAFGEAVGDLAGWESLLGGVGAGLGCVIFCAQQLPLK